MFYIYKYQFIVFFDIKNLNNSIFKLRLQIYNVNLTYIHRATCLFRTQRLIPKRIGLDKFPCFFTSDIIVYIERMSYNTFNEDLKKKFSAIALGYNLPGVTNLSLSREQIVGIYNGTFLYWNESTFLETNPNSIFPHAKIFVLAWADTSGSTAAFTSALSTFFTSWNSTYGMFSGLLNGAWQNGVITYFANCNRGMTGFLMSFPNSVGYISLSYATDASITYAKVENKAGYFVLPNISTIQESIDFYLNTTTSLVFPLIDSPAPMSYPISLFTYFIFHSDNVDNCYPMAEFVSYIRWIYNNEDAVKMCATSGFVPLSERLIRDVETKIIKDLTCGGHTIVKMLEDQKVVN